MTLHITMLLAWPSTTVVLHRVLCPRHSMCPLSAHTSLNGSVRGMKLWSRSLQLVVCCVVLVLVMVGRWTGMTREKTK